MANRRLKDSLTKQATNLGFSRIAFTPCTNVEPDHFSEWIQLKFHGQMSYLERNREKRISPELLLPGAKTLVVLQWPYQGNYQLPYSEPRTGILSRYAKGKDYHKIIRKRLRILIRDLRSEFTSLQGRFYIDTGPILEKYWAEQAGLGWIGKHTNLIDQERGSWFFLAIMLLNAEIQPDFPATDRCGTCRRCINACPTQAIVKPYLLDARKCISYLTIELREDIPIQLRDSMSNLIYGCDICQDVCPWNTRHESEGTEDPPAANENTVPRLHSLAYLNETEFDDLFKGRAVRRTKWRGMMRNVSIAMGNGGLTEFTEPLIHLLNCDDSMVRRHAAWGLLKLGTPEAISAVRTRLDEENDSFTRNEFILLLGN